MNITATPVPMPETVTPLELTDGCDRCGYVVSGAATATMSPSYAARAYVRVFLTSGGTLDFCGHCYQQHEAALLPVTASIIDNRAELSVPLSSGFDA